MDISYNIICLEYNLILGDACIEEDESAPHPGFQPEARVSGAPGQGGRAFRAVDMTQSLSGTGNRDSRTIPSPVQASRREE